MDHNPADTPESRTVGFRPVHPFPARMAPSLVWDELKPPPPGKVPLVLDPMAGSGTTVVAARSMGYRSVGFDTDPLAVIVASAWSSDVDSLAVEIAASGVVAKAKKIARTLTQKDAYPPTADEETRAFVRYWFDATARRQLASLARAIGEIDNPHLRTVLLCAFSRLIIVKEAGVSLAMDVAHSRPHKVYSVAPLRPFRAFERALRTVVVNAPFKAKDPRPSAEVQRGDARSLPLDDDSVDIVVTSPPYLNAIDYLRGHKFSLIWMGYDVGFLRQVRAGNVGTEVSGTTREYSAEVLAALAAMDATGLPPRQRGMLLKYLDDMKRVLAEVARVLKPSGRATFVVGDSTVRGTFVANSSALVFLARQVGLELSARRTRPLESGRRYLPPPGNNSTGQQLQSRMREEVILTFNAA